MQIHIVLALIIKAPLTELLAQGHFKPLSSPSIACVLEYHVPQMLAAAFLVSPSSTQQLHLEPFSPPAPAVLLHIQALTQALLYQCKSWSPPPSALISHVPVHMEILCAQAPGPPFVLLGSLVLIVKPFQHLKHRHSCNITVAPHPLTYVPTLGA